MTENTDLQTWNIVSKGEDKLVWKNLEETEHLDIKNVEETLESEPLYCEKTNSVVFKTDKDIVMERGNDYSELELISRHINTDTTLNEVFDKLD